MAKKVTIESLAGMMKKGFDEMTDGFKGVNSKLTNMQQDIEAIQLKLDYVAYRFEVKDLQKRLEVVEKKVGIKK